MSRGFVARAIDIAAVGVAEVLRHPLRSGLTAATSAVAIAVTVNVISLVYGLDEDLRRDTNRFGRLTVDVSRLPVIVPGMERMPLGPPEVRRSRAAVEALGLPVIPRRLGPGRAEAEATLDSVALVAAGPRYLETLDVPLLAGRWFEAGEAASDTCVLDAQVAASLFPARPPAEVVGRTVRVATDFGERDRRVLGVLEDPVSQRAIFESFDEGRAARTLTSSLLSFRNLYLPEDALGDGEYAGVSVPCRSDAEVDEVARRLREIWPPSERDSLLSMKSVGVFVRREWMDMFGTTSQAGAFLGNVVWMIIVGVAVVMLTTQNLMTIRERYDELAIRRVEGAGKEDVAWQITVEGVVTALAGGLVGLPLGQLGATWLRELVEFPFRFEVRYAVVATGVAILIGLFASVLPARHAAALQPARVLSRRTG